MNTVIESASQRNPRPGGRAGGEIANETIESPSEGSLWRAYLTSVLNKPIREEEVRDEIQTAA